MVFMVVAVLVLGITGAVVLIGWLLHRNKENSSVPKFISMPLPPGTMTIPFREAVAFRMTGMDRGFRWSQLGAMLRLARITGLRHPGGLLGSVQYLDSWLTRLFGDPWRPILDAHEDLQDLVLRLLEYRMDLERNRPRRRKGMDSTRTVQPGQVMKVILPDNLLLMARVQDVARDRLRLQVFAGRIPVGFTFRDKPADVWYWRSDDAMYQFATRIMEEPEKNQLHPLLSVRHSDNLVRRQKRAFLRARVHRNALIMPWADPQNVEGPWVYGEGYPCLLLDISESGAAIAVRGTVRIGTFVRLCLEVPGRDLILAGWIKSVDPKPRHGASLLHMEAAPPSPWMRACIMAYVLGILKQPGTDAPERLDEGGASGDESFPEISPEAPESGAAGMSSDTSPRDLPPEKVP